MNYGKPKKTTAIFNDSQKHIPRYPVVANERLPTVGRRTKNHKSAARLGIATASSNFMMTPEK